ncbi:glucosaminidase domain-containing protein [Flavisolibacter ginsengisoli]|jgi:LysM repeat protein|uniref:Peptidoglycan hydrolase n=1 Tax=Flavisolibacter ginsengisoli DSM 18119 TaxID=1121884 RepID=A0A1M5EYB0_9BACT|nr:glucosaminidase domain-containing protein [Flavisolibacter ginsengisoli]SHF84022.1 Flagellum-specific peptidoglycan hydrolase FlgJ [Flavisolibacter ginsengisoli DSM 18119]
MKKLTIFIVFLFCGSLSFAQSTEVIQKYIDTYKDIAIEEMNRTGVPAAITLAQGIHETSAGQSDLVRKSNNHFGIKCKAEWSGPSVSHDDDARGECFRKYDDPIDSYKDHSDFLRTRPHYAFLFNLDPTDYEAWAYGLKKAGYATNPRYPQILIKLIKDYNLEDYTLIALNRKTDNNNVVLVNNSTGKEGNNQSMQAVSIESIPPIQYPSGLFKINETKVVFIPKGTSYLKVAEENDISLARLFEFNDLHSSLDIAQVDQLLFLQRKRKKGANEYHIVMQGETLHDVAQNEGIRLESLLEYNFLKYGMQPKVGEKLFLQNDAPAMPALVTDTPTPAPAYAKSSSAPVIITQESKPIFHKVQSKETLYAISRKYDVTVEDIIKWNELQSNDLRTGQQLRINKKTANGTN